MNDFLNYVLIFKEFVNKFKGNLKCLVKMLVWLVLLMFIMAGMLLRI